MGFDFSHIFNVLKRFPAHSEIYDSYTLWLNIVGGISITISFFVIGVLCLIRANKGEGIYSKLRIRITKLLGLFLIACACSRGIDTLCIWRNLAILSGYAKLLTGFIAFITIYYIPTLLKDTKSHDLMKTVKDEMQKTRIEIEKVKEITKKL